MKAHCIGYSICVSLLLLASCGTEEPQACTEIGCGDSLTVEFGASGDEFQLGTYGLVISVDGTEQRCEWEVRAACEGGGTCVVGETCAEAQHTTSSVTFVFEGTPTQVDYELTRDGLEVAAASVMPEYSTVRPNGPGCPPTCEQATQVVEVP